MINQKNLLKVAVQIESDLLKTCKIKGFLTASLQRCSPTLSKGGPITFALIFFLFFISDAIIPISWYYCIMFSTGSILFENSGAILVRFNYITI